MAQPRRTPYTREDFLAWEANQADRWEFVSGRVAMMAGGTAAHNLIAGNVFAALYAALGDGPCVAFQQNQKLAAAENEDVTYPDVLVTCRSFSDRAQTIADATLIVEVLSPSTRQDDLDHKWAGYQRIADLRHYLVLETDTAVAVLYSRDDVTQPWSYRRIEGLDSGVELPALGVSLAMTQVYRRTAVAV